MRKLKFTKLLTLFTAMAATVATALPLNSITAEASVPYRTFTQNGYGELVETQTAYTPLASIEKVGDSKLNGPSDIKIANDGTIYIADTGNQRIVVTNKDGELLNEIGKGVLQSPEGVFVTEDKTLYVADKTLAAIIVYNAEGNEIKRYTKPNSPLYGNTNYMPIKVAVDNGGTMYIVSEGNTNGIIQITDDGQFLGYFGTNASNISVAQRIKKIIYGDSAKGNAVLPTSIKNVAIDEKGLIYTLTQGTDTVQPLKKLNKAGVNMTETDVAPENGISVAVGQYENIFVATESGRIFEYNSEGSLLFLFGGADDGNYRVGLFGTISAIATDKSDQIYVLDNKNNEVQVFKQTEFTELLHKALVDYQKGQYTASKKPLQQVITMNSLFDYANLAMAEALYQEEDYESAMDYYRLAKEKQGYSDAYWEVRNVWLRHNIVAFVGTIIGIIVLLWALSKLDKKFRIFDPWRKLTKGLRENMTYKRLTFGLRYMKHPIDGAYEIKRKGMQSYPTAIFIMIVIVAFYVINKYFCGFLVKTARDGRYDVAQDILYIVFGLLFATACTYLVTAINDGEGTFKNIFCGYIYSFTPFLVIQPFIFIVSKFVTYNEYFLISFLNLVMIAMIIIALFITIKEINNYSMGETFKVIALTIFAAFIFAVMAFVLYVLFAQVVDFVVSIYREAVYRIGQK